MKQNFMNTGNRNNLLKQVQRMQKEMQDKQQEIQNKTYKASSGGGVVEVEMSGTKRVLNINISDDLLVKEEKETLTEMLVLAVNNAIEEIEKDEEESMQAFKSLGII